MSNENSLTNFLSLSDQSKYKEQNKCLCINYLHETMKSKKLEEAEIEIEVWKRHDSDCVYLKKKPMKLNTGISKVENENKQTNKQKKN